MDHIYSEKENRRLRALEAFDILDSRPEDSFDLITSVAARCCGADIALVSFVDRDRQWFKSKVGIDTEETSREVSFCSHTMKLLETRKVARELAEVSSELKTLRSMIPICANCKSIRNDADEWKRVEHYFQEHTGASFSHGICPDCHKKLCPELHGSQG